MRMVLLGVAAALLLLGAASPTWAGSIECDPEVCNWSISVDFEEVAGGTFEIDEDGDVTLEGDATAEGDGYTVGIDSFSGNVDPEIVFGLGATNTSNNPLTYSFSFSLPIGGLEVPITTFAELGTTLTPPSGGTGSATVFPILGVEKIVDSQDISFNPFESIDKGVDIGDAFTATGGTDVRVETESGVILTGGPYDLMTVVVAFGLTDEDPGDPGAGVGFSGKVIQELPEPATTVLLGAAFLGYLATVRRRS